MKNNDARQDSHDDPGNFSSGFVIGALIGATGFFLTKTDEGKEIRKKVFDKWGSIKEKLENEGVITGEESTIVDFISNARGKVFKILGQEAPKKRKRRGVMKGRGSKKSKAKSGTKASEVAKSSKRRKKMFKGV